MILFSLHERLIQNEKNTFAQVFHSHCSKVLESFRLDLPFLWVNIPRPWVPLRNLGRARMEMVSVLQSAQSTNKIMSTFREEWSLASAPKQQWGAKMAIVEGKNDDNL